MGNLVFSLVVRCLVLRKVCLRFVDVSECVRFRRRIFYSSGWSPRSAVLVCDGLRPSFVCVCVRTALVSDMPRNKFRVLSVLPPSGWSLSLQ